MARIIQNIDTMRVISNKQVNINISDSERQRDLSFSEQLPSDTIGPTTNDTANRPAIDGNILAVTNPPPAQINKWVAMPVGDDGLKQALYDWINTTKDGVKVTPDVNRGRQKKLVFDFYGNIGKSIMPGEIGEFSLIFNYPPQAGSTNNGQTPIATNNNTNISQ